VVRGVPLPPLVPRLSAGDRVGARRRPLVRGLLVQRGPLPLPAPPLVSKRGVVFGMCALDDKGRISDSRVVAALGWEPGLRVSFSVALGVVVVVADDDGGQAVCGRGCLRVPVGLRRAVGIGRRERVLLAALTGPGRLIVHPVVQLDCWSLPVHAAIVGGAG
jgi:hypothetical protein